MFLKNIFILCFKKSKNIFGFKLSNIFLKKNKNLFLKTINKQAYLYCFLWKLLLDSETGPRTGHSSPFDTSLCYFSPVITVGKSHSHSFLSTSVVQDWWVFFHIRTTSPSIDWTEATESSTQIIPKNMTLVWTSKCKGKHAKPHCFVLL